MANLNLSVEILGEFRNLTKATTGSQKELNTLNNKISGFSSSAKKAFASIGVGLSFAFIARELGDAAEAAIEDQKSQALLATQLKATTGANDAQIASVEKSISKWQTAAGVADDVLRPAYATLVRNTGDVTKANELMAVALDVSAGSGKSLDAVALALSKSFNGNDAALVKLLPSVKGMKDPLTELARQFDGAAAAAANNDPINRMNIIFGEMQEKVGVALLPVLEDFSAWLASPGGTEFLEVISTAIADILTELIAVAKWAIANKDWLVPLVAGITALTTAWNIAKAAAATYAAIAGAAALAGGGAAAKTGAGAGALSVLGPAAGVAGAVLMIPGSSPVPGAVPSTTKTPLVGVSPVVAPNQGNSGLPGFGAPVTVNITTPVTAKTIVSTVSQFQKSTGSTLAQALR